MVNEELMLIVELCNRNDVTILSVNVYDRTVMVEQDNGTPTLCTWDEIVFGFGSILGIICSHCGKPITADKLDVKGNTEYEGVWVNLFDCPYCGKEIDDLSCEFMVGVGDDNEHTEND